LRTCGTLSDVTNLSCRVLTVHGSKDQIVPVTDALEFEKNITNHRLRIIEGADHEFTLHQAELATVILDFIRECRDQGMTSRL